MVENNLIEEKTNLILEGTVNIALANEKKFEELAEEISFKEPGEKDRKFAEGFLRVARDDLKAARILYEYKLYDISVYHLEQSIEKIVKAYLIMLGKLTTNDFCVTGKASTHESTRIIVRMFQDVLNKIDKIHKDAVGKPLIPKEEKRKFDAAFIAIKELRKGEILIDLDNDFKTFLEDMIKTLDYSINYEDLKEVIINKKEDLIKSMAKIPLMLSLMVGLYMLSALTFSHEAFTRYPRCEGEKASQPWEYSPEKYEFVKEEHLILNTTEKCLNVLNELMYRREAI